MELYDESFADKVRKGKILSPLHRKFCKQAWGKEKRSTKFDEQLYLAGLAFHAQFSAIRKYLSKLNTSKALLSNTECLEAHVAIAVRNSHILRNQTANFVSTQPIFNNLTAHSIKFSNNSLQIDLSLEEHSLSIVDGSFYVISSNLDKKEKNPSHNLSEISLLNSILNENKLSQLYNMYESYWNAILYEQTSFKVVPRKSTTQLAKDGSDVLFYFPREKDILLVANEDYMVPYHISNMRMLKIQSSSYTNTEIKAKLNCLEYDGEKFTTKKFQELDIEKKSLISHIISSFSNEGTNVLLKEEVFKNYSLEDIVETFIQLSSIGYDILNLLPADKYIQTLDDLKPYSFAINKSNLIEELSCILNKDIVTISKIIMFLTFTKKTSKGQPRVDLWRKPLISINDNEVLIFIESVLTSVGIRCIEGWLQELGADLQKKGNAYENYVKQKLHESVKQNAFFEKDTFLLSPESMFSSSGQEEEIDLLFKIDNLVVIGEAKCVVVSDSPISYWHSLETIKQANQQIKRKTDFVKSNLKSIFKSLEWEYDENIQYHFQPIILMSNSIGVGCKLFNVPVVDIFLLSDYFKQNKQSIFSNNDYSINVTLYNSKSELIENFPSYIANPPIIQVYKLFTKKIEAIPLINTINKVKWSFERVSFEPPNFQTIFAHKYGFEVSKQKK